MRKALKLRNIRRSVCIMANKLKKAGYSLSQAFRKAWRRVKASMTFRAAGVTFENRQERLSFLKQFRPDDLSVTLEREPDNSHDPDAIKIVVHISSRKLKTLIGYVPKALAGELAKVIDAGIPVKASLLEIIGGYSYKESIGALINVEI